MSVQISYDEDLLLRIARRFDLREPNRAALTAIIRAVEKAGGEYRELVADLATGVGKTFLMAAFVEYLAVQGVRHVLVVTPGSTIQRKTLANFDEASAKYAPGAEIAPAIITPENFQTATTGTILRDESRLKVFVFNIQLLIRPSDKVSRRVRDVDENLGDALYGHLESADDLFVIADEHHIYHEKAKAFSAAIRDLHPVALIGLTATPDVADYSKLVFQYTLAEAIADGYVKVPVIVYRKGGITGEDVQLRDACRLLERKEQAYATYRQATLDAPLVKPCLFVVCQSIKDTERVGQLLAGPGFIDDPGAVLQITSDSSEEALEALASVESPDSPIRAIVSVNMLREGWDVRNIAVIVALRRLASQTLTEQILGRGLRLPFGQRTGVPQVDQVDIVAHDSYEQLLRQKNSLAARIEIPDGGDELLPEGASTASGTFSAGGSTPPGFDVRPSAEGAPSGYAPVPGELPGVDGLSGGLFGGDKRLVPVGFADLDVREQTSGPKTMGRTPGSPQIVFPRREARLTVAPFELSNVPDGDAEAAGSQFTQEIVPHLFHTALEAVRDGEDVKVREVTVTEAVGQAFQGIDSVAEALRSAIMRFPEVTATTKSKNGAFRLAKAFLRGAGVTTSQNADQWGQQRLTQAVEAMRKLISEEIRKDRREQHYEYVEVVIPIEPIIVPDGTLDAKADSYVAHAEFGGWNKSVTPTAAFDAKSTEWELARLLDDDPDIAWWLRIKTFGQVFIQTATADRYYPDFIVIDQTGRHWLVEGKSDKEAPTEEVQVKKTAAEQWARAVRDEDRGDWHYLFATETSIQAAHGTWDGLVKTARPE